MCLFDKQAVEFHKNQILVDDHSGKIPTNVLPPKTLDHKAVAIACIVVSIFDFGQTFILHV